MTEEKQENRGGRAITRRVRTSERRNEVMKQALTGKSIREIAGLVGVTRRTVAKDIRLRLKEAAENNPATLQFRELQRQRINVLLSTWWDKAMTSTEALDRVIRLMEREARLLGLDTAQSMARKTEDQDGDMPAIAITYILPPGVDADKYERRLAPVLEIPAIDVPGTAKEPDHAGPAEIEEGKAAPGAADSTEDELTAAGFLEIVKSGAEPDTP